MSLDPATLYSQLGRLLETMPVLAGNGALSNEQLTWIGRAGALVEQSGKPGDSHSWGLMLVALNAGMRVDAVQQMKVILYSVLGRAELAAPASVKGTFIPAGNAFDAFASLAKLFQAAQRDILIVDPYMDEVVLTDFASSVPTSVMLRLLADSASHKPSLVTAGKRWITQYGAARPLQVRASAPKALHDRAILIDGTSAWTLTQSLKDFAKRSPAEIVRADDVAALKIAAYEAIWNAATQII
jgi:hypothetical protein